MNRLAYMTLTEGQLMSDVTENIDYELLEKMLASLLKHFFNREDTFSELMDHYASLQLCFLLCDSLKAHQGIDALALEDTLKVPFIQLELLDTDRGYQMKISIASQMTSLALAYGAAMLMSLLDDYAHLHLLIMFYYTQLLEEAVKREDEEHETVKS